MIESVKPQAVRLTRDFAHYDSAVTGMTTKWRRGQVIDDPAVIALLTGINAPIEPIVADNTSNQVSGARPK